MGKRVASLPAKVRRDVERQLEQIRILIRSRRLEAGLTQEQMAEALELSVETLKAIESGRRSPSLPKLFHILAFLELKITIEGE